MRREAPELTWADGTMHAHLDGDGLAPLMSAALGYRTVAEHFHESSWEVLCAIEAAGTFRVEVA